MAFGKEQRLEIQYYGEMHDSLVRYIEHHVPDEEKADEIYQKVVDMVISLTDQ